MPRLVDRTSTTVSSVARSTTSSTLPDPSPAEHRPQPCAAHRDRRRRCARVIVCRPGTCDHAVGCPGAGAMWRWSRSSGRRAGRCDREQLGEARVLVDGVDCRGRQRLGTGASASWSARAAAPLGEFRLLVGALRPLRRLAVLVARVASALASRPRRRRGRLRGGTALVDQCDRGECCGHHNAATNAWSRLGGGAGRRAVRCRRAARWRRGTRARRR